MAEKTHKPQAKKSSGGKSAPKKSTTAAMPKGAPKDISNVNSKATPQPIKPKTDIPPRMISSIALLISFVLFLFMALIPDGVLIVFFRDLITGLIGNIAFYISVPALLYLFVIHAFSGNRPIAMRTICVCIFIVSCGAIGHIS